jgi:hypothetical protein
MILSVASRFADNRLDLAIANNDPAATKADPKTALAAVLKTVKPGDFLKVTYTAQEGSLVLSQVEKHTPLPGETDPEAYEFVKQTTAKVGDQDGPAVIFSQADKELTLVVGGKKDSKGLLVPDAALLVQVKKLRPGDLLNVETTDANGVKYLKTLRPYQPPAAAGAVVTLTGTFVWTGKPKQVTSLKAVLTPTGPGEWKAVYTFTWGGAMTFTGALKGDLRDGKVTGTGAPAGAKRTFEFDGTAANGVISFKHFETTGGKRTSTGAGTLQAAL